MQTSQVQLLPKKKNVFRQVSEAWKKAKAPKLGNLQGYPFMMKIKRESPLPEVNPIIVVVKESDKTVPSSPKSCEGGEAQDS